MLYELNANGGTLTVIARPFGRIRLTGALAGLRFGRRFADSIEDELNAFEDLLSVVREHAEDIDITWPTQDPTDGSIEWDITITHPADSEMFVAAVLAWAVAQLPRKAVAA